RHGAVLRALRREAQQPRLRRRPVRLTQDRPSAPNEQGAPATTPGLIGHVPVLTRYAVGAAARSAPAFGRRKRRSSGWNGREKVPCSHSTRSWLATKIELYVPLVMPISSTRMNVRIVEPPKSSNASSVKITVSEVVSERPTVCSRLSF